MPTLFVCFLSFFLVHKKLMPPINRGRFGYKAFHTNGRRKQSFVRGGQTARARAMESRRAAPVLVATPERKYFSGTLAATAVPASTDWTATEFDPVDPANTFNLCSPGPGTGINQRVGRKILVHALKIRGILQFPAQSAGTTIASAPTVRVLVVQDKQTNGAQVQGETIMAAPGTAAATNCMLSYQNLANFGRFRVLHDKLYAFQNGISVNNASATTVSTEWNSRPFKININFREPVVVHFNAAGTALVADIVDNSFHILATADANTTTIAYESRAVYTDA